jgi:hypothetical protein
MAQRGPTLPDGPRIPPTARSPGCAGVGRRWFRNPTDWLGNQHQLTNRLFLHFLLLTIPRMD